MNVLKLQKKYADTFDQSQLFEIIDEFRSLDVEEKGVDKKDVINFVSKKGEYSYDQCRETLKQVDVDASGKVELDDYVDLVAKLKGTSLGVPEQPQMPGSPGRVNKPAPPIPTANSAKNKVYLGGKLSGTTHSINDEERTEFTRHINSVLSGDDLVGSRLPFDVDTFQIFDECRDGLVLSKLINDSVPDTIDTRVLNLPKSGKQLNNFQMSENANIVINSAKAIGCVVVNVHSDDIIDGKEHLILGLIWQIIRRGLLLKVDIKYHPELYRLLEDDETLEQFLRLPPEQILLRWFNYHLKNAGSQRRVANFGKDIADGENYTVLLHQLVPDKCGLEPLQQSDVNRRAEMVLDNADRIGCRKYLTPKSLVAGNPKLNLAFVANLFNNYPGLDPIEEHEQIEIEEFDAEGEREARVFTLWLNSLDVDPPIVSLFEDLKDGLVLLQAFEKVMPGTVLFKHVNKKGANGEVSRFKDLENTNYAVEIGKANHFSLVGIEGLDIVDGNKLLTLGLVWQLMRRNIVNTLAQLNHGSELLSDSDMLKWANGQVTKGGKQSTVRLFKDSSISSGKWLLDVLNGLRPGYVDYDLVYDGPNLSDDEKYANAKLAISIARKIGALIWLVPEDINEVRGRLVLSFIGSLMAVQDK